MSEEEEIFIGREKEIEEFFAYINMKDCPAVIVIGEPGIGKSSFMREVTKTLERDENIVVGLYEVPFSANVANPFVGVLEKLMDDLATRDEKKARSLLKRVAKMARRVAIEKGDRIVRALVKDLVAKLVGERIVEEFEKLKAELDKTPTIYSLADQFVHEHRSEFIYAFQEFFDELIKEFPNKEFVLLIDQFERALMPSCDVFLDFVGKKNENVHVAVALEVEEKGSERLSYFKTSLERTGTKIVELGPLSIEEIGDWMRRLGKDFSHPELEKIRELSAGFPMAISEWLKTSKECDLQKFKEVRGRYCEFVKWRINGLRTECQFMVNKLSVLTKPLSVEEYEELAGIKTEHCGLFLRELVDKWVFSKYDSTFWFRHELIRFCIEQSLTESEKNKFMEAVGQFFEQKCDRAKRTSEKVDLDTGLRCAYHLHFAGKHMESLNYNLQFAALCSRTGLLDLAEDCYRRAIKDAKALNNEDSEMVAKGNLANVYYTWRRPDEASRTLVEILEYSRKKGDKTKEGYLLHNLAMIEQGKGNFDEAIKLYNQSLDIKQKLGSQRGIAASLHQLAVIKLCMGDYNEAVKLFNKSLNIKQKLGDQRGIALSYGQLGRLYENLNKTTKAANYYIKALNTFQKIGDKPNIAKAKNHFDRVVTQETPK